MRPRWCMSLVLVSLLTSEAVLSAREGPFRRLHPAPPPSPAARLPRQLQNPFSLTVQNWGETEKDAEHNALQKAQDEIRAYLAEQNHPLQWRPSLDYINEHLVKNTRSLPDKDFGDPLGTLRGVALSIEISPKDWQDMLRQDRLLRAESRMLLLAKLLVGVVAFLGAVAGYLRLEEMTKGYYTAWLRLAAIGFVTAVGAGIWLIS
jgi:hypothetical protein